jgi:glycosyltransferase involved in cell wall biosynthesis
MQKKVLMITNIPTPYRIPLFNELKSQLAEKGIAFKVIFGGTTYARRKWQIDLQQCQFDHEVLNSKTISLGNKEKTMFFYSGLMGTLWHEKPDISIVIGFSWATAKLYLFSLIFKKPFIIWSGSVISTWRKKSFFRRLIRKMMIKRAVGFVAYGTKAKEYLVQLGVAPERIEIGINTTDTEFFAQQTAILRKTISDNSLKHILYVGYLEPKKRIDQVLFALEVLKKKRSDFRFIIVGDGSDRIRLENLATKLKINDLVSFEDFKQKPDIPGYFARADCFVFPSEYDIWGMVLVEAMAAGLPCISSVLSGATIDLIREGETGFALDFSETEKVAERILWIFDHPEEAARIGANASLFIRENVTIEKSAAGFVKAIENFITPTN